MNRPYDSAYYELTSEYERFGNYYVKPGEEIYLYITSDRIRGVEDNRYAISNTMKVFDYKLNKFVSQFTSAGYIQVSLFNTIKRRTVAYGLHRVYMLIFCYFEGCEILDVNHIDGDKSNTIPINLEWLTHRDNYYHSTKYIAPQSRLSDDDIIGIINDYNSGSMSIKDIAAKYQISVGYINDITYVVKSGRINKIRELHPVTRENANKNFIQKVPLESTKRIKKAYSDPDYPMQFSENFSKDVIESVCKIFEDLKYSSLTPAKKYDYCISQLGLEDNGYVRSRLSHIYNHSANKRISSKYDF